VTFSLQQAAMLTRPAEFGQKLSFRGAINWPYFFNFSPPVMIGIDIAKNRE
jgi:hypothetical protein